MPRTNRPRHYDRVPQNYVYGEPLKRTVSGRARRDSNVDDIRDMPAPQRRKSERRSTGPELEAPRSSHDAKRSKKPHHSSKRRESRHHRDEGRRHSDHESSGVSSLALLLGAAAAAIFASDLLADLPKDSRVKRENDTWNQSASTQYSNEPSKKRRSSTSEKKERPVSSKEGDRVAVFGEDGKLKSFRYKRPDER